MLQGSQETGKTGSSYAKLPITIFLSISFVLDFAMSKNKLYSL